MKQTKYLVARKENHQKESYYNALILDWVMDACAGTPYNTVEMARTVILKDLIFDDAYIVKITTQVEKVK